MAIFEGDHEIDDMPDVKTELFEDLEVRRKKSSLSERALIDGDTLNRPFRFNQLQRQAVVSFPLATPRVAIRQWDWLLS